MIVLVTGPPCAGKNHHVELHRRPGDQVLDQDAMGRRGFDAAVRQLDPRAARRTWLIRCMAGPARRAAYAVSMGAAEHVHLHPPTHVLMARAQARAHPAREVAAVRSWLAQEAGTAPLPAGPSRATRQGKASAHARGYGRAHRALREQWRPAVEAGGVACWRCTQLITREQVREQGWHLGHDDEDRTRYRGPEHVLCNSATQSKGRATAAGGGDPEPEVRAWWA